MTINSVNPVSSVNSVLIIEDEPTLRSVLEEELAKTGFRPIVARDLRSATLRLKKQKFSYILLDIGLGRENGTDLIELIRKRSDFQNESTPIVLISGHLSLENLRKFSTQIQGALVKPFTIETLVSCLNKISLQQKAG